MDIPIAGPSYIYGDNLLVVKNASMPESTLNKTSNQVCYHFVREAVAMCECLVTHVQMHLNLPDLVTKIIPGSFTIKHWQLVDMLLYNIESESRL